MSTARALPAPTEDPPKRRSRPLTRDEKKVRAWVKGNFGILSSVAREFNLSPQFVQRVAYGREAASGGLRVEHRLLELGCPLIHKIK